MRDETSVLQCSDSEIMRSPVAVGGLLRSRAVWRPATFKSGVAALPLWLHCIDDLEAIRLDADVGPLQRRAQLGLEEAIDRLL
jgi:hypothetical protein